MNADMVTAAQILEALARNCERFFDFGRLLSGRSNVKGISHLTDMRHYAATGWMFERYLEADLSSGDHNLLGVRCLS